MIFRYDQEVLKHDIQANCGRKYQQCSISVMDTIADPDITFDSNGICNYYYHYKNVEDELNKDFPNKEGFLLKEIENIKAKSKNFPYDCILGVSGGVDSTYSAYIAKLYNLRVLCVHFDNGWDSELAVKNIENIVNKLNFDLYTYVINWEEFKAIQLAYFKANVIDIEAVTDIAIGNALHKICLQKNIKTVLHGNNIVTENVLPDSWICKNQFNLLKIYSHWNKKKMKSYPLKHFSDMIKIRFLKPYSSLDILNYVTYNKKDAKKIIVKQLGWRDYGGKHYESIFTRFYQGYILPHKFFVDKRKPHLSNLIFSGQITKVEAIKELKSPIYDEVVLKSDYPFVLKKLELTEEEFDAYIKAPQVQHKLYGIEHTIYGQYPILNILRPLYKIIKK